MAASAMDACYNHVAIGRVTLRKQKFSSISTIKLMIIRIQALPTKMEQQVNARWIYQPPSMVKSCFDFLNTLSSANG